MIVWICTDMEGLAGIDHWDQCYDPDDNSPKYRYGLQQLTLEVNAAVRGCFDAGATEVRVLDGHGRNRGKGFLKELLDPRAKQVHISSYKPLRWEGLDETVDALAFIGQHAMAGTLNGFLDHTGNPKTLCRHKINGQEIGELSELTLYAGAWGVPIIYASGDEALCVEAKTLFPHVITTPTKRGTAWATCDLYPPDEVRNNIQRDIAQAVKLTDKSKAWRVQGPIEVEVEWAYTGLADQIAKYPGVRRPHPRTVQWTIDKAEDIYVWPG